ncbi:MAG: phosphatidate cytidylyltransferase [Anaerolineaceae bacterium]|nr:phosphatidate cytidylyltransferase [Anaerolineaceae bacterium]
MLRTRALSAAVFVPLILLLAYIGGLFSDIFFLLMLAIGAWELCRLLKGMGYYVFSPLIIGGVIALILQRMIFPNFEYSDLILVLLIVTSSILALLRYEHGDVQASLTFALHLASTLYLGWLGAYFVSMAHLPDGRWWLIITMILIWFADMGAYFIGKPFGKHKMAPRLSPNKTWEGYFGGIAFALAISIVLSLLLSATGLFKLNLFHAIMLSVLVSAVTIFGDVFISMLKRVAGLKDSGHLIPGHGGILDRFDTWIWAVTIAFYFVKLIL